MLITQLDTHLVNVWWAIWLQKVHQTCGRQSCRKTYLSITELSIIEMKDETKQSDNNKTPNIYKQHMRAS